MSGVAMSPTGELGRRMQLCANITIRIIVIRFFASCHHICSMKSRKEDLPTNARSPLKRSLQTEHFERFAPA